MSRRSPIAVLLLLALTHLVAIGLFLAGLLLFGFDGTNFFALLLIPLGALMFGVVGSLGAIPGARLANYPPGPTLRTMVMAAAALAFAAYLLVIGLLLDALDPAHPGVLAAIAGFETQGEFVLTRGARKLRSLGTMGNWGYLLLALKFVGAAAGGLAVHESLRLLPYCASCRVFTRTREKGVLHFPSFEAWAAAMHEVPAEPWQRARHMLALPRQKALSLPGRHYVLVRLRRHECPACKEQHMRERVFVHNGSVPLEQKQLSSLYSWLPSDARSKPRSPDAGPQPRVFGRKIA